MIRPFTFLTMVLAAGSGLYLYSTKHTSQMLDREIARTVKETDGVHERIDMLRTEWALLNEPDRLAELARVHLNLKTLAPTQFVAANELATRLPAVAPPPAPPAPAATDTEEPTASAPSPVMAQAAPTPAPPPPPTKPAVHPSAPTPAVAPVVTAAVVTKRPERLEKAEKTAPHPVAVAVASSAPRPLPAPAPFEEPAVSRAAVAPGTIGESVLRAMRANARYAPAPAAPPARAYEAPVYASTYAPAYARAYATSVAAPPAASASLLGGSARQSLPPPVPFAAR